MNFTMLLELLGKRMAAEDLNDVSIEELINVGKDGIVNLNAYFNQASEGDE